MDELLKIIKISDHEVVDQLHHTPSKISILALFISSAVLKDSLIKILEHAYIDHDVTLD